jgi:hypothetical protein
MLHQSWSTRPVEQHRVAHEHPYELVHEAVRPESAHV